MSSEEDLIQAEPAMPARETLALGLGRPWRSRRALPAVQVGALWAGKLPGQPVSLVPCATML